MNQKMSIVIIVMIINYNKIITKIKKNFKNNQNLIVVQKPVTMNNKIFKFKNNNNNIKKLKHLDNLNRIVIK